MSKHTITDLYQMQMVPLYGKIQMTRQRIQSWVDEYGEDDVYVSFSGGKDSTVLLDIARKDYPDIKAVFVDTGLEYPEIRQFVKTFDNVDWLRPKMNFRAVIEKYGYPFISKEVAECVYGAKKYLEGRGGGLRRLEGSLQQANMPLGGVTKPPYEFEYNKLFGYGKYAETESGGLDNKYRKLRGIGEYAKDFAAESESSIRGARERQQNGDGEYP